MRNIGPHRTACGFTLIELLIVVAILAAMAGLVIPMLGDADGQAKDVGTSASIAVIRNGFTGTGVTPGLYGDVRYTGINTSDLQIAHLLHHTVNSIAIPQYNSDARKGWRGPYARGGFVRNTVASSSSVFPAANHKRFDGDTTFAVRGFFPGSLNVYGVPGDPALGDSWGNPFVLQIPTKKPDGSSFTASEQAEAWKYARIVSAGENGVLETDYEGALAGRTSSTTTTGRGDDIILFLNRVDVYE